MTTVHDARWARGLRRFREHREMTQVEVAKCTGLPHSSVVSKLESGRKMFSRTTLLRLTLLFGGTLSDTIKALDHWGSP